jgi:hypothetical protein
MKVAIGPSRHYPSWKWCAEDLIPGLQKQHEIQPFHHYSELPGHDFDVVMIVKHPPPRKNPIPSGKIIYLPIDYFMSASQISSRSNFLQRCDIVAVHCERLVEHLGTYCKRIETIEHYDKYAVPSPINYNPGGLVLWTGMCTYVKSLYDWYLERPRSFGVVALTNRIASLSDFQVKCPSIQLSEWSEMLQQQCFKKAKAGLDIKGNNFHQQTKPPTKIQQLIASGIPSAVNHGSYTWEYFHGKGLDLASPDDHVRWFSEAYWKEIHDFLPVLRQSISKPNVIHSYLNLIETA